MRVDRTGDLADRRLRIAVEKRIQPRLRRGASSLEVRLRIEELGDFELRVDDVGLLRLSNFVSGSGDLRELIEDLGVARDDGDLMVEREDLDGARANLARELERTRLVRRVLRVRLGGGGFAPEASHTEPWDLLAEADVGLAEVARHATERNRIVLRHVLDAERRIGKSLLLRHPCARRVEIAAHRRKLRILVESESNESLDLNAIAIRCIALSRRPRRLRVLREDRRRGDRNRQSDCARSQRPRI